MGQVMRIVGGHRTEALVVVLLAAGGAVFVLWSNIVGASLALCCFIPIVAEVFVTDR